ncbi:N-acetyltransferase [Photobacterium sagamiensis]|uniref:GNAT family N-acetyltransferase n=1 Tax=Photobacterium sagamiensis TaxID=2910241 RepID=UPI003D13BC06
MKFSISQKKQEAEITRLFRDTFSDSEGVEEGKMIGSLANDLMTMTDNNDLVIFVAMDEEKLIGSVIFTTFSLEDKTKAFLLSPMAISTSYQGNGIGQALIQHGLNTLKEQGVELLVTYGDPSFYSKVGFQQISEDVIKAPLKLSYPHGWLGQSLTSDEISPIQGASECVEALNKQEYW